MALTRPSFAVNNIQGLATRTTGQATAVKVLHDKAGADAKTYLIDQCTEIETQFATKEEVQDVILGQITDRSLTAVKIELGAITTAELAFDPATQDELDAHIAVDATETVKGHVELATAAETTTGTSDSLAVHPAGLKVELDKKALATRQILTDNTALTGGGNLSADRTITHATTAGFKHIPTGGATGQFVGYDGASGAGAWAYPARIATGSYTGDGTTKTITVGFQPKYVALSSPDIGSGAKYYSTMVNTGYGLYINGATIAVSNSLGQIPIQAATGFDVKNLFTNNTGVVYNWIAMG